MKTLLTIILAGGCLALAGHVYQRGKDMRAMRAPYARSGSAQLLEMDQNQLRALLQAIEHRLSIVKEPEASDWALPPHRRGMAGGHKETVQLPEFADLMSASTLETLFQSRPYAGQSTLSLVGDFDEADLMQLLLAPRGQPLSAEQRAMFRSGPAGERDVRLSDEQRFSLVLIAKEARAKADYERLLQPE